MSKERLFRLLSESKLISVPLWQSDTRMITQKKTYQNIPNAKKANVKNKHLLFSFRQIGSIFLVFCQN